METIKSKSHWIDVVQIIEKQHILAQCSIPHKTIIIIEEEWTIFPNKCKFQNILQLKKSTENNEMQI